MQQNTSEAWKENHFKGCCMMGIIESVIKNKIDRNAVTHGVIVV
jgi:hypothetical protein